MRRGENKGSIVGGIFVYVGIVLIGYLYDYKVNYLICILT